MEHIKVEPNAPTAAPLLPVLRKRKLVTPIIDDEELQRTQKRRTQQHVSAIPGLNDYKKAKEDQSEKYIQDLETKNKSLLAKITDLSNLNKQLCRENVELHNKVGNPQSTTTDNNKVATPQIISGSQNKSTMLQSRFTENKLVRPQIIFRERKMILPHKPESRTTVLNTQGLIALWEQVSSVPLPQCCCSKSDAMKRRRANCFTKKYKAYKATVESKPTIICLKRDV